MSQAAISRGKEIIKNAIRETPRGAVARIPVADEANLAVFQQALRQHDIQRMLVQKQISVEFNIPQPVVEQVKNHMLQVITSAPAQTEQIVFPFYSEDYADAQLALSSAVVQQALNRRNLTASLQQVGSQNPDPKIVVATYEQVTNGDLDRYLRGDS